MDLIINHSSMVPIYEQLTDRIRDAVATGELKPGALLPSVRSLAADLRISALTVKKAYDRLEAEGILVTVHGKGSFVSGAVSALLSEQKRADAEKALADAIDLARKAGCGDDEIRQLAELILEG